MGFKRKSCKKKQHQNDNSKIDDTSHSLKVRGQDNIIRSKLELFSKTYSYIRKFFIWRIINIRDHLS